MSNGIEQATAPALPNLLTRAREEAASEHRIFDAKPIKAVVKEDDAHAAAEIIQAVYRGAVVRCHLKEVREEAAITIQLAYRAHAMRRSTAATGEGKDAGREKLSKEEKKRRRAARKEAAKKKVQPFLKKHGFDGVKSQRQRFWRRSYPLHIAVKDKDHTTIKLLLRANADPKQEDSSGRTPLLLAEKLDRGGSHALVLEALKTAKRVHQPAPVGSD
jgi:hypothetical protein